MGQFVLPGGQYAAFIWPAYGATALAFAWMILDTLGLSRRWRRKVRDLETAAREGRPTNAGSTLEPTVRPEGTADNEKGGADPWTS